MAILLIGIASLVLGMGVPVTAAYLITAVLTVGSVSNMIAMQHFGVSFAGAVQPGDGRHVASRPIEPCCNRRPPRPRGC